MNNTNQVHTRAIIFPAPGQVTLVERDLEATAPGQLLVRTVCTLISPGTESTVLHQRWAPDTHWARWGRFPFSPGYSLVGVAEAVGERGVLCRGKNHLPF